MSSDFLKFLKLQRQIFGICPNSNELFRLSEARIFTKKASSKDWLDKIVEENKRLDKREESILAREYMLRERARQKGRKLAMKAAKKIDSVFTPLKLNPDDAKVIFHPVDFIVFNGMKEKEEVKNLIFLDRQEKHKDHRELQKSIEQTINKENYEWRTLRIEPDGSIISE